jgi:hypothetical protein
MIDLMAYSAVDRETEMTYVRRERDWAERVIESGRRVDAGRLLPVLPPMVGGNGHGNGRGNGHDGHAHGGDGHGPAAGAHG